MYSLRIHIYLLFADFGHYVNIYTLLSLCVLPAILNPFRETHKVLVIKMLTTLSTTCRRGRRASAMATAQQRRLGARSTAAALRNTPEATPRTTTDRRQSNKVSSKLLCKLTLSHTYSHM